MKNGIRCPVGATVWLLMTPTFSACGQGIPAINIGLPTRYAHSQLDIMDRSDYDNMLKLVVQMLQKLSVSEVRGIREFLP